MTTRIKIDISQGIVEAEGEEGFVRAIYQDFRDALSKADPGGKEKPATQRKSEQPKRAAKSTTDDPVKKTVKKPRTATPKIVSDLDLSGAGKQTSLRDFYATFKAKSNFDRNLIFIYYLKNTLNIDAVTMSHVFTCYRSIPGLKIPGSLEQSLIDTRSHKGWIDTTSLDNIGLTVHGINHLEHDLEKAEGSANAG